MKILRIFLVLMLTMALAMPTRRIGSTSSKTRQLMPRNALWKTTWSARPKTPLTM
ncbi:MAG: hypothetical protein II075_10030 [Bacteroidales bacterium]|nr:hypothetical protein [Bacteroidales bacterium]